ncbi:TNR9 factor, partial [Thinocorus orbignyianus]|nr:TNR9 factor [Thinocorus orbignyianus]
CRPCPPGTFSVAAELGGCTLCRKCEGRFRYSKACSPDSDAECGCAEGFRCGGEGCSRCERGCGAGRQSTAGGCQACRYGTFNDQPNGSCKNWTKCSADQVLEPGTAEKDVVCKHVSDNPTSVATLPTT